MNNTSLKVGKKFHTAFFFSSIDCFSGDSFEDRFDRLGRVLKFHGYAGYGDGAKSQCQITQVDGVLFGGDESAGGVFFAGVVPIS